MRRWTVVMTSTLFACTGGKLELSGRLARAELGHAGLEVVAIGAKGPPLRSVVSELTGDFAIELPVGDVYVVEFSGSEAGAFAVLACRAESGERTHRIPVTRNGKFDLGLVGEESAVSSALTAHRDKDTADKDLDPADKDKDQDDDLDAGPGGISALDGGPAGGGGAGAPAGSCGALPEVVSENNPIGSVGPGTVSPEDGGSSGACDAAVRDAP